MTERPAMSERDFGVGVPRLLEQLSVLLDTGVTLAFSPPPAGEHIRWRVYEGPQDSSKGTLGEGKTAYVALEQAFVRVVSATFRTGQPSGQDRTVTE